MGDFSEAQKIFMNELFSKLNTTLTEKTTEIREEINKQVNEIKEEFSCTLNRLQNKLEKTEEVNKSLERKIIFLERKVRKNNIVVFGIDRSLSNILAAIVNLFNEVLEVPVKDVDLNDVYRLDTKTNKDPPVVVEFISYQKKLLVLQNANKLKGRNIFIARDQCQEDRENTKELLIHQKEARNKGKTAFIKRGKLIVENETYTIDQLKPEEKEEPAVEIIEKPDSAPTTPNPTRRQQLLLNELGIGEAEEQEAKKFKPTPQSGKKLNEGTKIQTRSTYLNPAMKKK